MCCDDLQAVCASECVWVRVCIFFYHTQVCGRGWPIEGLYDEEFFVFLCLCRIHCHFLYCIALHTHTHLQNLTQAQGGPLSHLKGPGIPVVNLSRKEQDAMRETDRARGAKWGGTEGVCFCLTPALRRSDRHTCMHERTRAPKHNLSYTHQAESLFFEAFCW